ncbi:unnamed protein product [Rhizoctonia solani]|uniref:F-box domain-containing protein n=1 Tax=Rhizoctonia solani TaxID=456999 RepID=A0A8H3CPK5_9AGAM|nr:unnamed protein product [Rhizoctonia solani]
MVGFTATEHPSLKVFGIPELAHLICSTIRKRDNVSLMGVCRQIFHSVIPFVWEEVDEANALMSMIPGGGIVTYNSDLLTYAVMQLPSSLELSRFNIYAPHIKRLTPSALYVDRCEGWEGFLACTRSVDLLPNLEALHLPVPRYSEHIIDPDNTRIDSANWVMAFLSTSVQKLVLVPPETEFLMQGTYWLDFDTTNRIMDLASQKCPRLCLLSIFPAEVKGVISRNSIASSFEQVLFLPDALQIHSSILRLHSLSSLSTSPAILSTRALAALSSLPNLKSLCVSGQESNVEVYCDGLQIPIDGFPALTNLELHQLTWETILNLCKSKPIVTGLHSMTVSAPNQALGSDLHVSHASFSDIVPLLVANKSSITALNLHDYWYRLVSPESLTSWKHLPLLSLHLGWSISFEYKFEEFSRFLLCLPFLEELKLNMTQEPLDLEKLKAIVDLLPHLRRLWIPVEWRLVTMLTETDFVPSQSQSTILLHIWSDFYLPDPQQENAEQLAR